MARRAPLAGSDGPSESGPRTAWHTATSAFPIHRSPGVRSVRTFARLSLGRPVTGCHNTRSQWRRGRSHRPLPSCRARPRGAIYRGRRLLLGYGTFLNLAPFEFGQVGGLYLATLFIVWQVINFLAFRALPTMPIVGGGVLAVAGSAI